MREEGVLSALSAAGDWVKEGSYHTASSVLPLSSYRCSFSYGQRTAVGDSDPRWCWLGHGDVVVMDGQCQNEFLHCMDPCLEQERINVTFLGFCAYGSTSSAGLLLQVYRIRASQVCPTEGHARWAEVGGGIIFVAFWEFTGFHSNAPGKLERGKGKQVCHIFSGCPYSDVMLYVLAFVRLPSLHGCDVHVWCIGLRVHSGEIAGKICVILFLPSSSCSVVGTLWNDFGGSCSGICEDLAVDAEVDYLVVVEHRLLPARAQSLAYSWALASQDSSLVGNAGVGVVSMRRAPVALHTLATAQLMRFFFFFDCGRAIRYQHPLRGGWFMNLVVLCVLPRC